MEISTKLSFPRLWTHNPHTKKSAPYHNQSHNLSHYANQNTAQIHAVHDTQCGIENFNPSNCLYGHSNMNLSNLPAQTDLSNLTANMNLPNLIANMNSSNLVTNTNLSNLSEHGSNNTNQAIVPGQATTGIVV